MNETLREKEELSRVDSENLRKTKDEITTLRRKVDQHAELMAEKDRTVQILHDEISTTLLELSQVEERNQVLAKDNAKLLQRWLDAKQVEANRVNEANEFYETMRTRRDNVLSWRDGSGNDAGSSSPGSPDPGRHSSGSGKDLETLSTHTGTKKNGSLHPTAQGVDLTPNG